MFECAGYGPACDFHIVNINESARNVSLGFFGKRNFCFIHSTLQYIKRGNSGSRLQLVLVNSHLVFKITYKDLLGAILFLTTQKQKLGINLVTALVVISIYVVMKFH